jgi:hypothetical protein
MLGALGFDTPFRILAAAAAILCAVALSPH